MKILVLSLLALLLIAIPGCAQFEEEMPGCLWRDVGPITNPDTVELPPAGTCLQITAPENARVSAYPMPACEAPELGEQVVIVPIGQPVFRYSHVDLTPGVYVSKWAPCPAGAL